MVTFQDYRNMYNLCWWRRECQQCIGRQYKQYDALVEQKRVSRQAREIKDLMGATAVVVDVDGGGGAQYVDLPPCFC